MTTIDSRIERIEKHYKVRIFTISKIFAYPISMLKLEKIPIPNKYSKQSFAPVWVVHTICGTRDFVGFTIRDAVIRAERFLRRQDKARAAAERKSQLLAKRAK